MQYSANRILTTHTGSLPRPPSLEESLYAFERGAKVDGSTFEPQLRAAVHTIVQQQLRCGLDIINDGELGKVSYGTYPKDRLSGFGGDDTLSPPSSSADLLEFPEYAQRHYAEAHLDRIRCPRCVGKITYTDTGKALLLRDLENLKAALCQSAPPEAFMTAASPGVIASILRNQYYPSHEAYVYALAEAMKQEYDAIVQAGFLLQLDCPDISITTTYPRFFLGEQADSSEETKARLRALHVEALNYATRDIPADRLRLHMCWGNYEGPHHHDVPLRDLIGVLLRARPATLVLSAANPRHAHEWRVFEEVQLPEEKRLVLGVLDTTTNFIEHPDLVAERLVRMANLVGRERVIAGTDCGFAPIAGWHPVDPQIAWAKLQAMVEGARRASQQVWRAA